MKILRFLRRLALYFHSRTRHRTCLLQIPQLKKQGTLAIYSVYASNIPTEIIQAQAAVFSHLGLTIEQVPFGDVLTPTGELTILHGIVLEKLIQMSSGNAVIFFDIDCIPLKREIVEWCYVPIINSGAIIGPAQRANHLNKFIYAGPFALGFSKETYIKAGRPPLRPTFRFDTAGAFSYACHAHGIPVIKLAPTHCEKPLWRLYDEQTLSFGHGTTFASGIYHAFEMRKKETQQMFLRKCAEVLRQPRSGQTNNPQVL